MLHTKDFIKLAVNNILMLRMTYQPRPIGGIALIVPLCCALRREQFIQIK